MRSLAEAGNDYLYVPGYFPKVRREEDAAEGWMKNLASESFKGVHSVVDVSSDEASYRLMLVTAADESWRILGAYDFKTRCKR